MGFSLGIKLKGGQAALKAIRDVRKAAHPDAARQGFRQMALYTHRRVKALTPGEGTLRDAWALAFSETRGSTLEWTIHNRLADQGVTYLSTDLTIKPKLRTYPSEEQQTWGEVIQILDAGGKPHEITPKRVSVLSWWSSKNEPIFSRHVSHPGHKKYGMITKPAREVRKLFEHEVEERKKSILAPWDLAGRSSR